MSAASLPRPGGAIEAPTIDDYRSGDDAAIVACLREAFAAPARLERWRHLHRENPAGPSVIVVARHGGRIVGQIASLRRRLRFFGAQEPIAHALDTVVHPDWQHRGVFPALVAASTRALGRDGLDVTYGVANDAARHVAEKYEHRRPLGAFPVLVRPLRPLGSLTAVARHHLARRFGPRTRTVPECAAAGPVPTPPGPSLVDASRGAWTPPRFDGRHDELFAHAGDLPPIAFVRDAAALAWRYPDATGCPYAQRDLVDGGRVLATAVVRAIDAAGLRLVLVMEWHWRRGGIDAGRALARDVLALARRAGAHGVAAMGARGSAQRRALGGLGFLALPARAFPQRAWPGIDARAPHAADGRWREPANWYFTWGDGFTL
ncbi:MAG: GNAT family N-acetyltransferase [Deltaproteobacteria bacterium]|nr:GNAT family N-acetyltransferase [Deltaproteobacteria bacterium]